MPLILFAAGAHRFTQYEQPLLRALQGLDAHLTREADPAEVDYIITAPDGEIDDYTPFTRTKAVLSLWAGVERIVTNTTLTQPLCRMVDTGLREGMREWVAGHILRHHLGMDAHITGQDGVWRNGTVPPLARDRIVTVLGLGELGRTCAITLAGLGFELRGWRRAPRADAELDALITSYHGADGMAEALSGADMLVLLLPLTAQTENLINAERIALLAPGAVILNPGRGPLIDDDTLLAALDAGHLEHATLDVFRTEPLPPAHPFWAHPKITVTPHIASETRPETAAEVIAENIRRGETGAPLLHLVDRAAGY